MSDVPQWEQLIRLVLSLLLGGLLGWERQQADKPVGLRTMALVAVGCAGFVVMTLEVVDWVLTFNANVDPSRVLAGVIGGIGFLGAGTIIQSRGNIAGVTTAAVIWVTAAIGMACGFGLYALAVALCVLALITLELGRLSHNNHRGPMAGDGSSPDK